MPYNLPLRLHAIAFMIASMACFSMMNVVIRDLSHEVASPYMVFLRNIMSLLIMLPVVMAGGEGVLRTSRMRGHFFRALVGSCAMQLWFYAITIMPITEATALSFITPLFVTLIAIFYLKEKVGIRRIIALITGFIGALIIIHPGGEIFQAHGLFVIASALLMAVATMLVKTLSDTESPERIVFYMAFFMTLFSFPLAIPTMQPPSAMVLGKAFYIALFSTLAHLLLVRAYQRAPMTLLMPFDYTRLIFTGIMAYFLFHEVPDMWTISGAAIIVASTVYITHRETIRRSQ